MFKTVDGKVNEEIKLTATGKKGFENRKLSKLLANFCVSGVLRF